MILWIIAVAPSLVILSPPKIDNLNDMESSHYISRMLCLGTILLAGGLNLSEKYEFANWMESHKSHVPKHQPGESC